MDPLYRRRQESQQRYEASGATSMLQQKEWPEKRISPSYAQVGNDNLVKLVQGPLVYKATAQ